MIIFEEIKPSHKWIARWYLSRDKEIYFLRLNRISEKKKWVEEGIDKGVIKKIDLKLRVDILEGTYYDLAFDNVETFFHDYLESRILKSIEKLYGSPKSNLAFKKALNRRLGRFYYLNFILDAVRKKYPEKYIIFIPSNGVEVYRTDGCDIYDYYKLYKQAQKTRAKYFKVDGVAFSFLAAGVSYVNAFRRKFILMSTVIVLPFWLFFKCIKNIRRNFENKRHYDYAITIISPTRQFVNKIQKIDFLVDGKHIRRDQVVFVARKRVTGDEKKYFIENRLNFVEDTAGFISLGTIAKILPAYCALLFFSLRKDSFVGGAGLKGIYFYAVWSSFVQHIIIKKFVTYCDYEVKSVFRNIIFEQSHCETYLYMDSSNFGCFAAPKNVLAKFRHHYFGFLHYDWFVSWNDKVFDYFQRSFCEFKQHANLGCFWAEHVRLIQEGTLMVPHFKDRLYQNGYKDNMKFVSVFDSTFHDNSVTSYDDGINFLKGMCDLIDDLPDVFFILKEKKRQSYHETITIKHKEIKALYKKLEDHPRCYLPGEKENSSVIIAFSDLTISFPFTSTSLEAISARKKAVWYDASGKFRNTYYDDVPGLVCHSYGELLTRSRELLFETSEGSYNEYLDTYVKGKVESYLDGHAITRFRNLLNDSCEVSAGSIDRMQASIPGEY